MAQVQQRRRRPARPVAAATLGVQGRGGQQRGPGAGDGHVLDRQAGRQVTRSAADPEHLEPGREPVIRAAPGRRQGRPRLSQQARPQLFRHPAHCPRSPARRSYDLRAIRCSSAATRR